MGKQELSKDRVTSLLQSKEREDDHTATAVATPVADSDFEEEYDDDPEEAFDEENRYREPPVEPMYNVQILKCMWSYDRNTCARGHEGTHC